ncbi:MFS transporter [Aneurinibacillus sp. Ricciae_BoGa-3]|uniref:MFS transporter n=1 Tax=Aneurinibacillus sp. Ricciae_BoGa-3 TaxID=3022697 RepID=UPI002341A4EB|nr:MFS transporter [Aneurinibacillus sp. Ricciae_BoGa-3]WCK52935.1 MFS transporter [Aneurinibacillus sp. Ricciae_BoGa-3]
MRNIRILSFVSFFTDMGTYMVYPLIPLFLASVGTTPLGIGVIEGITESLASLLKFLTGYLADRMQNRKKLAIYGYGLSAVGRILLIFSNSWLGVFLWRFSDRFGKGIRTAPRDVLIVESGGKGKHGRSFGIQQMMDMLGSALGVLIAYAMIYGASFNYPSVFQYSMVPVVIGVFLLFFIKEPKDKTILKKKHIDLSWRKLDKNGQRLLIIILLFTLANSSNQFLILRASTLGVSTAHVLLLYLMFYLVGSFCSFPVGVLSDRWGRKKLLISGYFLYGIVYLGFALISSVQWTWLLFGLYGVYTGITKGIEKALVADVAPGHLKGTALGLYSMVTGIGLLPASLLTGFIWNRFGAASSFYLNSGVAIVTALLLTLLLKKESIMSVDTVQHINNKKD